MTVTEAIAAARAISAHDAPDTSVTDAQITQWVDVELVILMRELGLRLPRMMLAQASSTITAGNSTFAKPADFDAVYRLEVQSGAYYTAIDRAEELNANTSPVRSWRENPTTIEIVPSEVAPATYRLTYLRGPAAGYTTLDVPRGFEWVLVPRVAMWIDARFDDRHDAHEKMASQTFDRLMSTAQHRDGVHATPGLRSVWMP